MHKPSEHRRLLLGMPAWLAFSFVLSSAGARAQAPAGHVSVSVSLALAGHPATAIEATWKRVGRHAGLIEAGLDSRLAEMLAEDPSQPLLLQLRSIPPTSRVTVRQRSVTYLNIGDEGPHIPVPGTERRSAWASLTAASPGIFRVRQTVKQRLSLDRRQLAAALHDQPRWLQLAKACRHADEGACYTVTDPEFEVTVTMDDGRVTQRIVRVMFPSGC